MTRLLIEPSPSIRRPALRTEPRGAKEADGSDPEHIILIAGPSGSGKSTFLREFLSDGLSKEISDFLPAQAKTWQCTSANELSRKGLSRVVGTKGGCPGLLVHYDIMRPYTRRFEHYANDAALQAVVGASGALTVMTLLPTRETLFDQFLARAWNDQYEERWEKMRWTRRLRRKLRGALSKLSGESPTYLKEGHVRLLVVYGSERRLEQWTTRWESYLESVRGNRSDVRLVYAAPEPTENGRPGFRLLWRA